MPSQNHKSNNTRLSEHFTLDEFTKSDTAQIYGIDNTPNESEIENLRFLCVHCLEPLREKFGPIIINSGYRSKALNSHPEIKGVTTSQHLKGEAADIRIPSIAKGKEYFEFLKSLPVYDQLIWERKSPRSNSYWIHISIRRTGKNRKEVIPLLTKNK